MLMFISGSLFKVTKILCSGFYFKKIMKTSHKKNLVHLSIWREAAKVFEIMLI